MSIPMMRTWLQRWHRRAGAALTNARAADDEPRVAFRCNLCGTHNRVPASRIGREIPSCSGCGSTVRWRSLVHLICEALLGDTVVVPDSPAHRDIRGIGLSDDLCVANALARLFDYTNTFFHTEPRLDITKVGPELEGRYDFLTSSDVFEHVVPPVEIAFRNARRLLKPGGVFVLTVPFTLDPDTAEHFPELHDFRLEERNGEWLLHNRTRDGRSQCLRNLVFHGGPGTTLEMRVFSRAALERHLAQAGFAYVHFADEPYPPFGIAWPEPWSIPIVART